MWVSILSLRTGAIIYEASVGVYSRIDGLMIEEKTEQREVVRSSCHGLDYMW
jgi:hypothetical protein